MTKRIINGKNLSTKDFDDLYPFDSCFMETDQGHTMHYIDQGKGPAVVMVHGNPTWSFYFRNVIKGLEKDFRCIVPDHIGCGFSDKPAQGKEKGQYEYTLENRVRNLDELISHTLAPTEPIHFIVHDWGGMIALAWAVEHQKRIGKMVITNTAGFLLPSHISCSWILAAIKYGANLSGSLVRGLNLFSLGAAFLGSARRLAPKVRKALTAPYNCPANRIATLEFVRDIPLTPKDRSWDLVSHVDDSLAQCLCDAQLLFLWGKKDFIFHEKYLAEFQRRFPTSQAHLFETAGHYLFEDEPLRTVEKIREFLD